MRDLDSVISVSHPTDRPNFTHVAVGNLMDVWFSYRTPVAFYGPKGLRAIRNYWSTTTGKHLNYIDDGSDESKTQRLTADQFQAEYAAALRDCGLLKDGEV